MRVAIFILISCVLAVEVFGGEFSPEKIEKMKKCISESGIEASAVKDFFTAEGEPDQKVKCFQGCMAREIGILVDGNWVKDKIVEMIPAEIKNKENLVDIVMKCADEKGSDDCETAYLALKCLRDNKAFPPPPSA